MIFLAVAEEGNITKASGRLGYVQSNVSARIQHLEAHLQTTLFHRHSRGVTLTPSGIILRDYAMKVRHLLDEVHKAVRDDSIPHGPLVIGSVETTAAVRLPKLLGQYHRQYPTVDLSLITGPTERLIEQVLEFKLDGAFVSGPIDHSDLLQQTAFLEELVLVSEPAEFELDAIKSKTLLVFHMGCSYRSKLEQWLRDNGILPAKVMEFGSLDAILGGVSAGLGVTLMPKFVVGKLETEGLVRTHVVPQSYRFTTTVFIRRRDSLITSALGRFMELLHEHTNDLYRNHSVSV